jgi:hypothetical protein
MSIAPRIRPAHARACEAGLPEACAVGAMRRRSEGDPSGAASWLVAACNGGSALGCDLLPEVVASLEWPTAPLRDAARRKAILEVERDESGEPQRTDLDRFALELCVSGVARVCLARAVDAELRDSPGTALRFYALACRAGYPNGCAAAAVVAVEMRDVHAARTFAQEGCIEGSIVGCHLVESLDENHATLSELGRSFAARCDADPMRGCSRLDVFARLINAGRPAAPAVERR